MNKFVLAALAALGLTAAAQQQAAAWYPIRLGVNIGCCNYGVTIGFDNKCSPCAGACNPCCGPCGGGGGGGGANPWYTYYPYPAYFQGPVAGGGFPYWASQGMAYGGH